MEGCLACMQPLMPCIYPTVLLLPEMRYIKPEKMSPDRTLAEAFSKRLHHRASCAGRINSEQTLHALVDHTASATLSDERFRLP